MLALAFCSTYKTTEILPVLIAKSLSWKLEQDIRGGELKMTETGK